MMTPRRVNIVIGEPNVGKSNMLEAMSLLGRMVYDKGEGRFMEGQIRSETLRNLFYDNGQAEREPRLRALPDAVATARHPAYRVLADFVGQAVDMIKPF